MTLGALIDAGVDADAIRQGIASLGLPDVEEILNRGDLTAKQRELALRIFRRLAEAEATVHGMPLEKVHFHEVGALDSIADIVGVAIALDTLGIQHFTSRSVPTGSGTVKCAHGIMPIP